jgi:large subunit ribosomal protein L4
VANPKAPLLDANGKAGQDVTLEASVFAAEVKPHLVHEAVRAEFNASRQGTRAAKNRALVKGGRAKPWRQKGTGRARAGSIRAPQFTGGGVVFPPGPRSFEVKVNRKTRKAALRGALSTHASAGTLALVDGGGFDEPSTRTAAALIDARGAETPIVVVATGEETNVEKSFRNLDGVLVVEPHELEVAQVVWARTLLVTQAALATVQQRAKENGT